MKFLFIFFLILLTQPSLAKEALVDDCSHLKGASEAEFALFSKKEFIELGECLAVYTIERKPILDLPMLCDEVREDETNPLGNWSLTKLEAIYIGQCLGVIDYVYKRYNRQFVMRRNSWNTQNEKYSCYRGGDAVKIIRKEASIKMSEYDIRDLICKAG
jgi:hypothetical protein